MNVTRLNHTCTILLCVARFSLILLKCQHTREVSVYIEKSSCVHKKFSCSWEFKECENVKCKNVEMHTVVLLQCNCTTLRLWNFNTFTLTRFSSSSSSLFDSVSVLWILCVYKSVVRSTFQWVAQEYNGISCGCG